MAPPDSDSSETLERLQLMLYLVPIFGVVPSLWSLYLQPGSKRVQSVSRLAVTLAISWVLIYGALGASSQLSSGFALRLMTTNILATTGYFLTSFWLMVRLLQGRSVRLPGLSRLSRRLP